MLIGGTTMVQKRGRKRRQEDVVSEKTPSCDAGVALAVTQESSKSQLHGVQGRFLKASDSNAEAHATALVLGRLYLLASERNVSDRTLPYLLTLLQQSGALVGAGLSQPSAGACIPSCLFGAAQSVGATRLLDTSQESDPPVGVASGVRWLHLTKWCNCHRGGDRLH